MNFSNGFGLFDDLDEAIYWFSNTFFGISEDTELKPVSKAMASNALDRIIFVVSANEKFGEVISNIGNDGLKLMIINNAKTLYYIKQFYLPAIKTVLVNSDINPAIIDISSICYTKLLNSIVTDSKESVVDLYSKSKDIIDPLFKFVTFAMPFHDEFIYMSLDTNSIMKANIKLLELLVTHPSCMYADEKKLYFKLYPSTLYALNDLMSILFKFL